MKKVFSVLTVAVLAVSTVFAGLSGSVTTSAGYNLDTKDYGFLGTELANAEFALTLGEESVEKQGEGNIYASVKASMSLAAAIDEDVANTEDADFVGQGLDPFHGYVPASNLVFNLNITEAKIGGENWYVNLLGLNSPVDLASSFADLNNDHKKDNVKLPFKASNGIEAAYADYVFGVGFEGNAKAKSANMAAYFTTPEISLVDGLTLKAGVAYAHHAPVAGDDASPLGKLVYNNKTGAIEWKPFVKATDGWADQHNLGGSVKVAYAKDALSASVASDLMVVGLKADEPAFKMDLAANVKYDFISGDVYYAYKGKDKNELNIQAKADLASFDVPVNFSLGLLDIVNDGRKMTAGVGFAGYGATVDFTSQFGLKKDADWKIGVKASYTVEDIVKIAASVSYDNKENLGMSVSAENDTLIPGATLSIGWYGASDLLEKNNNLKVKGNTTSTEAKWTPAELAKVKLVPDHSDFGVIKASVKVAF